MNDLITKSHGTCIILQIPVPYHMNEELIDKIASKYTYSKIKSTTEILILGRSS